LPVHEGVQGATGGAHTLQAIDLELIESWTHVWPLSVQGCVASQKWTHCAPVVVVWTQVSPTPQLVPPRLAACVQLAASVDVP
jgi:hypothetical protein